jgi:hypothetical protein
MDKQIIIPVTPEAIAPVADTSPEKAILANLKEHLAEVPGIRYIDQDWGQLDDYSPNFPVQWPCVLIDVSTINYSNLGQDAMRVPANRQQGEAQLTVKVANLKLTNSSSMAGIDQQQDAAAIHELRQHVHNKLHGYRPGEQASKLIRTAMQRIRRDDGVQEYEISYSFALYNV